MGGILAITDGTKRVNWLSPHTSGIYCKKWNPGRLEMKGGGEYHDSPLADGRILTDYRWANIVDSFTFTYSGECQDDVIYWSQECDRLLIQGANYWLRKNNKPVWIESRGSQETNTRYAVIHGFKTADDNNPYQEPFAAWLARYSVATDLVIAVEHGPWLAHPPTQGEATEMGVMYSSNYLINSSFEEWSAGVPTGWTNIGSTLTETTDPAFVYHGSTSCHILSAGGLDGIKQDDIVVSFVPHGIVKITAKVYLLSGEAFLYAGTTGSPTTGYATNTSTTITGQWITLTLWKQVFGGPLSVFVGVYDTGAEAYFDDVRVERFFGNVEQIDNRAKPLQSSDDATTTDNSSIALTGANLNVGWVPPEEFNSGIRFRNVSIPQGTIVRSAWLELHILAYDNSPVDIKIDGEDTDDSATFSTIGNYNGRTRTTEYIDWECTVDAVTSVVTSPDISNIIQEIVDRPGWVSGNNLTLFLNDDTVHGVGDEYITTFAYDDLQRPAVTLFYILDQQNEAINFTVAETTDPIYIANKQNDANLTHIFRFEASGATWSTNLLDQPLPYDLLVSGNGSITYFGIEDSSLGGPFASIVFNTDAIKVGAPTMAWEYYDGAAWQTLPDYVDWTDATPVGGTAPFSAFGLISLHFDPPDDWAVRNLFTEHGGTAPAVTGWWIRLRVTSATPITVIPQQQEYDPYTIIWPYTEIQADEVGGDIPAIAECIFNNLSDGATATARMAAYKRVMMATRRISRGEEFRAYLNCSDVQVPSFMQLTLSATGAGATTAYIDYNAAPTGRCVQYDAGAVASTGTIEIKINRTQAEQFFGRFRIYLRVKEVSGGSPVVSTNILFNYGKRTQTLQTQSIHTSNDFSILDFGEMVIPGIWYTESDIFNDLVITINLSSSVTVGSFNVYDLILLPIDEVVIDSYEDQTYPQYVGDDSVSFLHNEEFGEWTELVVDSIRDPRKHIRTYLRSHENLYRYRSYIHEENSPLVLEPNERLRVWFLGWTHPTEGTPAAYAHPTGAATVEFTHNSRYTGMRGRR